MYDRYGAAYGAFSFRAAAKTRHFWQQQPSCLRSMGALKTRRGLRVGSREALARARAANALHAANPAAPTPAASRTPSGGLARAGDTARERRRSTGRRRVQAAGATRGKGSRGASTTPSASSGHGWRRIEIRETLRFLANDFSHATSGLPAVPAFDGR